MDSADKKKIQSNLTKLVKLTKLDGVLKNKLLETEVLTIFHFQIIA